MSRRQQEARGLRLVGARPASPAPHLDAGEGSTQNDHGGAQAALCLPKVTLPPAPSPSHLDAGGLHAEAVKLEGAGLHIAQALLGVRAASRGGECPLRPPLLHSRPLAGRWFLATQGAQLVLSQRGGRCGEASKTRDGCLAHHQSQVGTHNILCSPLHLPEDGALVGQGAALHLQVALGLQLIKGEVARQRGLRQGGGAGSSAK